MNRNQSQKLFTQNKSRLTIYYKQGSIYNEQNGKQKSIKKNGTDNTKLKGQLIEFIMHTLNVYEN